MHTHAHVQTYLNLWPPSLTMYERGMCSIVSTWVWCEPTGTGYFWLCISWDSILPPPPWASCPIFCPVSGPQCLLYVAPVAVPGLTWRCILSELIQHVWPFLLWSCFPCLPHTKISVCVCVCDLLTLSQLCVTLLMGAYEEPSSYCLHVSSYVLTHCCYSYTLPQWVVMATAFPSFCI